MSFGFAPVAPIEKDYNDGFKLTKTFEQNALQNLKMFILTSPGERIMVPAFGLGITRKLFENDDPGVREDIKNQIVEGVARYLPYIKIYSIYVTSFENDRFPSTLTLQINFSTLSTKESTLQKLNITL
jgi:phage baseplate assembly protein W